MILFLILLFIELCYMNSKIATKIINTYKIITCEIIWYTTYTDPMLQIDIIILE